MSSERWRQIEELYHLSQERGEAVLAGTDPEIRREVERLLAQDSESGGKLLDQDAVNLMTGRIEERVRPGSRLGPYQIEALLGQGGMGRVYRATDTRLGRPVAIKICNRDFADRFEQETRAIAAISHPNVCTLYDVGPNYLVMELLEGETLAAPLKRGKLTTRETIRFGAAHARGIFHRDLKPGNVMLTKSGVKVLDFGLAKAAGDPSITAGGHVIGTPAYIAPERVEGKEADARTDIFALGLILSEMAAGKFSGYRQDIPPALDRVIRRCLEKDPDDRWQSVRDLKWELETTGEAAAEAPTLSSTWTRSRMAWPAAALGAAAILLAAFALVRFGQRLPPPPLARMSRLLPERSRALSLAVSPDGRSLAVVLVTDGKQQIWIPTLDSFQLTPLAGTEGGAGPFWSSDSRYIGFFADAKLKKIESSGGRCKRSAMRSGFWAEHGRKEG